MNRRGFFALLGAAFAARALPAAPVGRLPPLATAWRDGGHVFYSLPFPLPFPLRFHEDAFALTWPRIGDTIHVKIPIRFKVAK